MANTTYINGKFVSIELDGTTVWDLTTVMPDKLQMGIKVKSISVYAASTVVIICRNAKAADQTSAKIFHFVASAGQLCCQYLFPAGAWMYPAFHGTDCGAGTVVIELE